VRPLLIGEAPAATTPAGWPPFYGRERSAGRLWDLGFRVTRRCTVAGTVDAGPGNCDAINLIPEFPGSRWPLAQARELALGLRFGGQLKHRTCVILVGRKVARAFGVLESRDWFEWFSLDLPAQRFAVMPHPSGLNHWWNKPAHVEQARKFVRELIG